MSIIYDALKKSQQARAAKAPVAIARKKKRINRKHMLITLLILTAIFAIAAIATHPVKTSIKFPMLSQKLFAPKHQSTPVVVSAIPRLMLDGVFLSDKEKLAMINRRSYHEGDIVSGMKVVSIAFDQVQLKNKTNSIVLRNAITDLN